MKLESRLDVAGRARRAGRWMKQALQGAVLVAVAASVPSVWSAGGVQVNNVAVGTAAVSQHGSVTTIRTTSHTTIINYQRLSVGAGETLQFLQPSAASRVLNRIQGSEPTRIDGTLLSNGRVYLVNPAGVMFGNGAVVNVGGLYAAAGHISDKNFIAGNNLFTDNSGTVQNAGLIKANQVHLVGQNVSNSGQIEAMGAGGIVTLTAGKEVYLGETTSPTGQTGVLVRVSADTTTSNDSTAVSNTGSINAGRGELQMGAGDLYAVGILNNGSLKAHAITLDSNKNTNISNGAIDASSAAGKGGKVELLGDRVAVNGLVDASGPAGGGIIHVGGEYHGGGTTPAASRTFIGLNGLLKADATVSGNGGEVIVWADEVTRYFGNISVMGGPQAGNGGFVEVSGKNELVFNGGVIASAPKGSVGTLLLDPASIDVNSTGTASFDSLTDVDQFSDPSGSPNNRIDPNTIQAATANVVLQATGDITFSDNVLISTVGIGLTAQAGGNITVNADLRTKGGIIVLSAGDSAAGGGFSPNGVITVASSQTVSSTNGQAGANITLRAHDVILATGGTSCNIGSGTGTAFFVTNNPSTAINIGGSGGYNLIPAELFVAEETCSTIVIGEQGVQTAAITWDAAADYSYNPVIGSDRTVLLRLNTSGAINVAGDITPSGGNDHINLAFFGGPVTVSGAIDLSGGNLFSGGTTYTGTGTVSTSGTGEINILHSGAVSIQAAYDASSTGTIRLAGSTIAESGAGALTTGQLAVRSSGNVTLNGTNTIVAFGAVDTTANSTVSLTNSVGINYTTTPDAVVPAGFTAFAAVSGIATNNGNATLVVNGEMTINNPLSVGTGALSLTTLSAGIQGSGANAASGGDITLNAATGIGTTAAPVLAPTGNISLTTAGANAAGNISVTFFTTGSPGTLSTSKITTLATDAATAQDITLAVSGDAVIDSAFTIPASDNNLRLTATGAIQGDGNALHTITAPVINLNALGIGTTTAVNLSPAISATLTTTGTAGAGDIRLTTTTALTAFTFNTDNGSVQSVAIENPGALDVTTSLLLEVGDTIALHAGTSGAGNLTFSGAPTIRADGIVLWAGAGDGSASTAIVDFTTAPTLANQAGTSPPAALTIRQDAAITDASLTTAVFTGAALPASYTLRSDGGNVTINTAANIAGSNLALVASKSGNIVSLNTALSGVNAPASLSANATTIIAAADINTAGSQTYNGAFQLNTNITLTATDITFNGAVNSQLTQLAALTTTGSGTVWFQGNVGGTPGAGNELGSLDSSGAGTTQFGSGANSTVITKQAGAADGHIAITGNVSLRGNTTFIATTTTPLGALASGEADVTFTGTINSQVGQDFALAVNTPGVTWFKGSIGSGGALGGVTTDFQGGALEVTQLGAGGSFSIATGSPITFNDDVVLMADTSLTAPNPAGDVTFGKTILSDTAALWTLDVSAGSSIWFKGSVGAAAGQELGAITTIGTGTLQFGDGGTFTLTTREDTVTKANATGAQNFSNAVALKANTTLTALNTKILVSLGAGEDDITLGGALASPASGLFGISVVTPGVTWFKGGVSTTAGEELGSITTDLQGGAFELTRFGTAGTISVITRSGGSATGAQIYGDEVVLTGSTLFRGPSLAFNASPTSLDAGAFNVTLASNDMSFAGGTDSVQGAGNLAIQPLLDTDAIVLGRPDPSASPNTLFLSLTDLQTFKNGFASITIGSPTGSHAITVSSDTGPNLPVAFNDPVTIQSPTGSVTINGINPSGTPGLYGADDASITLHAATTTLNASVMTNGNAITIDGNLIIGALSQVELKSHGPIATSLSTPGIAGGNVTVTGTINDDATLSRFIIDAGFGVTLGNVDLQGVIGGTTPLNGFAVAADDVRLHASIFTTGPSLSGGEQLFLTHSITFAGNADPAIPTTITLDTDSSGATADAGAFTAAGVPVGHLAGTGDVNLVIDASAGAGHSGAPLVLGVMNGFNNLTLAAGTADVTVAEAHLTGALLSSGAAFSETGGISAAGVTITHTGAVTIGEDIFSPTAAVSVTGSTINIASGAPVNGLTVALASSTSVTIDDTVSAADGFTSTGSGSSTFTLNTTGAINTTNANVTITHAGGLVTLDAAIAAGTGVVDISGHGMTTDFGGTITGGSITLAGNGAGISIGDDITASGPLGITGSTINVLFGSPIHGSTVTFTDTAGTGINDVVTAANGFTSTGTGTSVFVLNSFGSINTTNSNVTITHAGGLVTLNGAIVAGTGVVNVSGLGIASASGGTIGGGSITLAGNGAAVALHGAVNGSSAVSVTGSAITLFLGAPMHGTTVTWNDSAGVIIGDIVTAAGGFTSIGSGSSTFSINTDGGITTTDANVTITHAAGLVTLGGPILAGAGVVNVSGLGITTTSGIGDNIAGAAITLAGGTGNVLIGGVINGSGLLTVTGAGLTTTAGVSASGAAITMTGPVSIQSTLAGNGGAVNISGTTFANTAALSGAGIKLAQSGLATLGAGFNATSVAIDAAGITQSAGIINATNLAITGAGIFSLPQANTIGTLAANITGPLTLTNAAGIAIGTAGSPAINGISATGGLTLAVTGATTLSRDITASAGNVSINSAINIPSGSRTISALDITLGDLTGAGNLTLTASGVSSKIKVGAIGTSPGSRFGDITFQGFNLTQLGGDIFADTVSFITRSDVPTIASIFRDGSLAIDTSGSFNMGKNQKLTVHDSGSGIGDLTIKTSNQPITVGDLSALGKITLDTGNIVNHITLLNRAPAHEILPSGVADPNLDIGMDIVAGFNGTGAIKMVGTVVVIGADAAHRVQFSSVDASTDIAGVPGQLIYLAGSNLLVIPRNIPNGSILHENDFVSGLNVLDLVAIGVSGSSPTSSQGSVIPRDIQTLQPERGQTISGALRDALRELGIYARDPNTDEVLDYLVRRAMYNDLPLRLDPLPTDYTVASNRLPYAPVVPTVEAYRNLFFKQELDANGNPVMENGKPKMVSQDTVILNAFGQCWLQYTRDMGDNATPLGFRGYLEGHEKDEPKFAAALGFLNQLRDLVTMIKSLGLTDTEFDVSRKVLLAKVRPANIKEEDFWDVVNGPTTRAGPVTAMK